MTLSTTSTWRHPIARALPTLNCLCEQSLSNRTQSINDPRGVYKVYDAIITYYDQQALGVMAQAHPAFVDKALANWGVKQEKIMEDLEAQPLGLSRQ